MDSSTTIYSYGGTRWGFVTIPSQNLVLIEPLLPHVASPSFPRVSPATTQPHSATGRSLAALLGSILLTISAGGVLGTQLPMIRLEGTYLASQAYTKIQLALHPPISLPPSAPVIFEPLVTPDGSSIDPINKEFSLIIPKVGINTAVTPNIDPTRPDLYSEALRLGVAHSATSYLPDQNGTVYLFSHSTNYEWFVKDLNAVFYLLKNLEAGDTIVIFYKGNEYVYKMTQKKVVQPTDISYLVPKFGKKQLILQTCWPPGSVAERLLIVAELVNERGEQI